MKIGVVLYGDYTCPSSAHADGLARALIDRGNEVAVAVPSVPTRAEIFGPPAYPVRDFDAVHQQGWGFPSGGAPSVIHVWTPREITRRFVETNGVRGRALVIVHLEDNEKEVTRAHLGDSEFQSWAKGTVTNDFPSYLTHPVEGPRFLTSVHGATVLVDALTEHLPTKLPTCRWWPSTDSNVFAPQPIDHARRKALGVPEECTLVAYHGNTHLNNEREVRSLYLAIALLNREGHPAKLLRTGVDHAPTPPEQRDWAEAFTIDLGFIENRSELASLLSLADVFVQPGRDDEFNRYRFPSKIPDFLSLARPVIVPRTNVGAAMEHRRHAWVLEDANGPNIADAIVAIRAEPALAESLAKGGHAFFQTHLQWPLAAERVHTFYESLTVRDVQI